MQINTFSVYVIGGVMVFSVVVEGKLHPHKSPDAFDCISSNSS